MILIKGVIGSCPDENGVIVNGVQLMDVVSQIHADSALEVLEVQIDSPGGDCDLGYEIYNLLKAQKKPIKTIIIGECCSIATVPFLAGDIREIAPTGKGPMIHNPWGSGISGDADEIAYAAEMMREEEDKLIDFYHKHTGIDKASLDALMKQETYLTIEQASTFNFTSNIQPAAPLKAVAFSKYNLMSKTILEKAKALASKMGIQSPAPAAKALKVKDANGVEIETNSAGDVPLVGDTATIDGQPAEGTYDIPDNGLKITCAAGIITEVAPLEEALTPEEMLAQNVALKARVTELESTVASHVANDAEVEATLALIEKTVGTNYVPPARSQVFAKRETAETPKTAKEHKEAAEKRKASYKKA